MMQQQRVRARASERTKQWASAERFASYIGELTDGTDESLGEEEEDEAEGKVG